MHACIHTSICFGFRNGGVSQGPLVRTLTVLPSLQGSEVWAHQESSAREKGPCRLLQVDQEVCSPQESKLPECEVLRFRCTAGSQPLRFYTFFSTRHERHGLQTAQAAALGNTAIYLAERKSCATLYTTAVRIVIINS